MLACVDVDYRGDAAVAACLTFSGWRDAEPSRELTEILRGIEPYQSGALYRRELPCVMKVLSRLAEKPSLLLIDGYVWLGESRPGLGAHLHSALGRVPIVGVAKTRFMGAAPIAKVLRGESRLPLLVSAIGCDLAEAAANVRAMHGEFRLPTLIQRVDHLCRSVPLPAAGNA